MHLCSLLQLGELYSGQAYLRIAEAVQVEENQDVVVGGMVGYQVDLAVEDSEVAIVDALLFHSPEAGRDGTH